MERSHPKKDLNLNVSLKVRAQLSVALPEPLQSPALCLLSVTTELFSGPTCSCELVAPSYQLGYWLFILAEASSLGHFFIQ